MVSARSAESSRPGTLTSLQGVTKRAGRKKDAAQDASKVGGGSSKPQVKKAVFESTKKKEVGVSDLTLISKISNEAINDNLKKRFENAEIYVRYEQAWRHECQR
jgi:myosin heavy subunit